MPRTVIPHPDTLLGEFDGVKLYCLEYKESAPLYRRCKLMSADFILPARRTAYLSFKVHLGEFVMAGDAWQLRQRNPDLFAWCLQNMAANFDRQYLFDTFDLTDKDIDDLIAKKRV